MIIDIEPKIEKAKSLNKLRLEVDGHGVLYVVRTAKGKEHSVVWDKEGLGSFCPKRTVSEMLKSWQEGIEREIKKWEKAKETGEHPTWTDGGIFDDNGKRIGTKMYKLPNLNGVKRILKELYEKRGEMIFVKLV